jgi:hypothetical protein
LKTFVYLIISLGLLVGINGPIKAQSYNQLLGQDDINAITTAVPFLLIAPDSRAGAMGDIGVSTSPDANSQHWNASKYAFIDSKMGFSLSYSPWLRSLVNDISLAYLTGYYKINEMSAVSGSLRYFSLGYIQFTDKTGADQGEQKPNEFALDAAYSRKLGDNISGSVSLRYVNSNLTQGQNVDNQTTQVGQAVAADVGVFYNKNIKLKTVKGKFAFGANISNIGNKISYSESLERDFIPMNLRFGPSLTLDLDNYNQISFAVDINKLLVPTPPIYAEDSAGNAIPDGNGWVIESGMDPNRGIGNAIFSSWNDAPGGFSEELREFYIGAGAEYIYDKKFFIRGGYFYENETKGNRKYFTLGLGFKYNVLSLDLSYLIPTTQKNPMEKTLRFTLLFNFNETESK